MTGRSSTSSARGKSSTSRPRTRHTAAPTLPPPVARAPRATSIRAGKTPHGEFDAIAGQHTPGLDLGHVGGLGKPAEHLPRLLARGLPRQREGLAPERVARTHVAGERFRRAPGDVGWTAGGVGKTPHYRNVVRNAVAGESHRDQRLPL